MAEPEEPITVRLLGGFEVRRGAHTVALPGPAARLVAITALKHRTRREAIVAQLWPDAAPGRGQSYLRSALWRLRALTPDLIVPTPGGFLTLADSVGVDAVTLGAWALTVARDGLPARVPTLEGLGQELLPGWPDCWLDDHREQLRVLVPAALEALAGARLAEEMLAEALWYALQAHQCDPLRESAVRILVHIHQAQNNHSLAKATFDQYRRTIRAELGIEPSPALAALLPTRRRAQPFTSHGRRPEVNTKSASRALSTPQLRNRQPAAGQ